MLYMTEKFNAGVVWFMWKERREENKASVASKEQQQNYDEMKEKKIIAHCLQKLR